MGMTWMPRARRAMPAASSRAMASPSALSCSAPGSAAAHPILDGRGHDDPGNLVREEERLLEREERNQADEDRDGAGLGLFQETLERLEVVDGLSLRERRPGLDLGPQLRELDLLVL